MQAKVKSEVINPMIFIKNALGIEFRSDEQKELVKAIIDFDLKNVAYVYGRQEGASFALALGLLMCADMNVANVKGRGTRIGVFAYKYDLSYLVGKKIIDIIGKNREYFEDKFSKESKSVIEWKSIKDGGNGSVIEFLSADEQACNEGKDFDIIAFDNAQKISNISFEKILPRDSSKGVKIIQVGSHRYNYFYQTVCNTMTVS